MKVNRTTVLRKSYANFCSTKGLNTLPFTKHNSINLPKHKSIHPNKNQFTKLNLISQNKNNFPKYDSYSQKHKPILHSTNTNQMTGCQHHEYQRESEFSTANVLVPWCFCHRLWCVIGGDITIQYLANPPLIISMGFNMFQGFPFQEKCECYFLLV